MTDNDTDSKNTYSWTEWSQYVIHHLEELHDAMNKLQETKSDVKVISTKMDITNDKIEDLEEQLKIVANTLVKVRIKLAEKITLGAGGGLAGVIILKIFEYLPHIAHKLLSTGVAQAIQK